MTDFYPAWLTTLAAASPGVAGMGLGLLVSRLYGKSCHSMTVMLTGVGGIAGYLILAGVIYGLDRSALPTFTPQLLFVLIAAALASFIAIGLASFLHVKGLAPSSAKSKLLLIPIVCWGSVVLIANFFEQTSLPASGWDGLDWYVFNAARFIELELATGDQATPFVYRWNYEYIQPITITLIASFSGWLATFNESGQGAMLPWYFVWLCTGTTAYGFITWYSGKSMIGVLAGAVVLSVPLAENHALIAGYTEIWLAAATLASATLTAVGLRLGSKTYMLLGIVFSIIPFALKNTGFIYAGSLLAALVLSISWSKSRLLSIAVLIFAIFGLVLTYRTGFSFELFGDLYAIEYRDDVMRVSLGGRTMNQALSPISAVFRNEAHALFVNSSFSLVFVALGLAAMGTLTSTRPSRAVTNTETASAYLIICAVLLPVALMMTQIFLQYSFLHATPDNDTGNSRFTLPAALLAAVASISYAFSMAPPVGTRPAQFSATAMTRAYQDK